MAKKKISRKKRRAVRAGIQTRIAMIGIFAVVCLLLIFLVAAGRSMQKKIEANQSRLEAIEEQTEEEEARTEEIGDLEEYMQSDEYTEKIAKEKIGLVKDNEIIFKENK